MAGPLLQPLLILVLSLALGSARQAGVLVNKEWVLTVAHCYMSEYIVQMGSDLLVDGNAQKIRATESFIHPRYDTATDTHDIMLVKLSSPAKLSPSVRIVNVPSSCKQPETSCTVSGWGSISMDVVRTSTELMCSNVNLISYEDCREFHRVLSKKYVICAAPPNRDSLACKGDLGSPLMCQGSLQGLVSSNYFPCRPPFGPVIYTRVCRYSKWIYETMRKNS
ncbi:PREDICTED: kallikrein-7-like [Miniopterus natalensis]|uniref:kallikrein-7-like n=1 Tax=Miniopterus natalensis TaxID=291302 RepID=UPI0007A70E35|nr:PREDICTED: kallikrein-7-like [Miniopterus natalensis]